MVTAICAWLRRQGVSVAPFKAQNMSNNSYPCASGGEIGRAQVSQAEACGLEPEPAMNPILLKPSGNGVSQVIVHGRVWKTLATREYYAQARELKNEVLAAYTELARRFEVVVVEGAGSVSELNLRQYDLVNLGLATAIDAPWLLVADIERGGIFGSIIGTVQVLTAHERALYRGFLVNKFRGDITLFDEGVRILEERTGSRCFGVFPFADGLHLDPEDSLALVTKARRPPPEFARIAIVRLPHISNATDFRLLDWADWVTGPRPDDYDFIVIPGTKNTINDLDWLRASGLAEWMVQRYHSGATVIGICGGYQMLGGVIADPLHIESARSRAEGLGLIPATTVLKGAKHTRSVSAALLDGTTFDAYEIHVGDTTLERPVPPFARLSDGMEEGVWSDRVIGTYLHGALEHPAVCAALFGVTPNGVTKRDEYKRMATWFDRHQRSFGELGFAQPR
jgi:adenosylcobyric acid synthase